MRIVCHHLTGGRRGQREVFGQNVVTVGRDPSNDLCFDMNTDLRCSGFHAEIRRIGRRLWVKDNRSRNGTFVNGQRVNEGFIESGDTLTFGYEGPQVRVEMDLSEAEEAESAPAPPGDAPRLPLSHVRGSRQGASQTLAGRELIVGRGPGCHLRFDENIDRSVSGRHGRFTWNGDHWGYEDLGSQNGSFLNGRRIERADLKTGDEIGFGQRGPRVRIGAPQALDVTSVLETDPLAGETPPPPKLEEQAKIPVLTLEELLQDGVVTIGRADDQAIVLPHPSISRRHARIRVTEDGYLIEDAESTNGVFVDSERIAAPTLLRSDARIHIGVFGLTYRDGRLVPANVEGNIQVTATDATLEIPVVNEETGEPEPRPLLEDISLVVRPGEFVAILGPSGAGKSLLMSILSGRRAATSGSVVYNQDNLLEHLDFYRRSIGYVPQQDIVHTQLTVASALTYAVKLRLPQDTSRADVRRFVEQTMVQVGLEACAHRQIGALSGGQLKRVSLGVELVANPRLLFLDEVTSSQDAGTDLDLMTLFRRLADTGRTVICTTHNVEYVDLCDLVCVLHRGRMVFFAPPQEMEQHFSVNRLSEVYSKLKAEEEGATRREADQSAGRWVDRYRGKSWFHKYVEARRPEAVEATRQTRVPTLEHVRTAPLRACRWIGTLLRHFRTLSARYVNVLFNDGANTLWLIFQAILIAVLVGAVMGRGPSGEGASAPAVVLHQCKLTFFLVLATVWFGCSNAAREVVKERSVFLRERAVSVSVLAYLFSKAVPLAAVCAAQCAAMLYVVRGMTGLMGSWPEQFLVLFATSITAMLMGLAISSFASTEDRASFIVPVALIPQVVLSGAIVPLAGVGLVVARCCVIAYWAYDAMKVTVADAPLAVGEASVPMAHVALPGSLEKVPPAVFGPVGDLRIDLLVLGLFSLAFLVISVLRLKSEDLEAGR